MEKTRNLFKKTGDIKGTFHTRTDPYHFCPFSCLPEVEEIKKRWQEYTEELYKKGLNDLDNRDGVVTHLELDILKCEAKWALGNITMNKAREGDGIPVELFQILKDDAVKCCTQYASKPGKPSSGYRTGKGQFSFQSQRRAMPKNAQTTTQLHSSHMLASICSSYFTLGFSSTWTEKFQMYKLGLEKAEEPEIKLPTSTGLWRKQRSPRKTSASASLTTLNPLTVQITTNCGKFSTWWEYQTTLPVSWETCVWLKKQ